MAKRIDSTPKKDGYRMPGEFEPQEEIFMIWPERPDTWRNGGKPAQEAFTNVAEAINRFEPVTVLASCRQYVNARNRLSDGIRVIEVETDDSWVRDSGPTFVKDDKGGLRAVDWEFNAWGGLYDGLYFPWDKDNMVASKICEVERIDSYKTTGFVLEGGSFHVDGQGTVLTTEMCLLSEGRNPHMSKKEIEDMLKEYLNAEKVIWIKDGIDPDETNGHIDDVACFVAPGEVACIWTDNEEDPFYEASRAAYEQLSGETDARGRKLKVHKLTTTKVPVTLPKDFYVDAVEGTVPRKEGELCIASYANFLIVNGGVIVPQYDDENDALALQQTREMFPDREVVGVRTREIVYGGGNIHCITQQKPRR